MEDKRKAGLKKGLRQLKSFQLQRILDYKKELLLDGCNYKDGKFCPLAVACNLQYMQEPSDEKVVRILKFFRYSIYNTRGIKGNFYTTNRKEDLITAIKEVLHEKHLHERKSST